MSATAYSPSLHEQGERAGVRGAFSSRSTKPHSPRVPARRAYRGARSGPLPQRHSREGGNPVLADYVFVRDSIGTLKPRRTRLRAAPCLRYLKPWFRPDGGLLFFGFRPKKSNQKKCDPMSAPTFRFRVHPCRPWRGFIALSHPRPGHPWPGVRACWSDIESLQQALTPALLGQGWPVCETRREREAQGTVQSLRDWTAQTSGRCFFGYFLVAGDKKVTRLQGGTAISICDSNASRASAYAKVSEQNKQSMQMQNNPKQQA